MNERDPEEIVKGLMLSTAFGDVTQYAKVMNAMARGLAAGLAMQPDRGRMITGMNMLFRAIAEEALVIHEKASDMHSDVQAAVARHDPEFQAMLKGLLDG